MKYSVMRSDQHSFSSTYSRHPGFLVTSFYFLRIRIHSNESTEHLNDSPGMVWMTLHVLGASHIPDGICGRCETLSIMRRDSLISNISISKV